MFQAIGHKVFQLQRTSFGGVGLGSLKTGKWRFLNRKEIDTLKKKVALK
jgi:16S rRNA U516 pseudouridylate synthase RsuA-like enzyme